jgi:hypothetical protein
LSGSALIARAPCFRHALDPRGRRQSDRAEPPRADVYELLVRDAGAVGLHEETTNAIQHGGGLSDAVPDLRRCDLGAVRRLASRIRFTASSSDLEANGGQNEHDCHRSKLTKSHAHVETEAILPSARRMR